MNPLDWFIFSLVLLATILSVLYGYSRKKTVSKKNSFLDHLIMGRQLTLPMFVATLVATWYGGIFGVTRIAFNKGIYNFITQGFFWYLSYLLFALFIIKRVSAYNAVTLPELIGKMFGPKSLKLSAIFNFFNVLPISYAISIGLFLQLILGTPFVLSMFLGILVVVSYSLLGGFRAVVFSDVIQFGVMCLGVLLILLFSIYHFGGLEFLENNLPANHLTLSGGESIGTILVWGFIALSTLVDPNFYQRVFAAKSPKIARNGIFISTIIWFCFDICTTFGAMYARAVIPEANSANAYLVYALQILPPGIRGLMLAGILATILSTLDSYLFLAGTTLSYDLAPKRWKRKMILHHLGIILVGILSVALAVVFKGNIKTVWKTLGSYSASCLLLPVLYGHLFPGKIKDNQFIFSCLLGVAATSYWQLNQHTGFWANIDALYIGITATSSGLLIYPLINRGKN